MSTPKESEIIPKLLSLLSNSPSGMPPVQEVYKNLAEKFPELTLEEKNISYRNSKSKFANQVQFARLRCVDAGLIFRPMEAGPAPHGFWKITEKGKESLKEA